MSVFIGGNSTGRFDGFSSRVEAARAEIGRVPLAQGANIVMLTVAGRSSGSNGTFVGIDAIELSLVKPASQQTTGNTLRREGTTIIGDAGLDMTKPVLAPGAKLYRFAHQNLDGPPTWADSGAMDLSFNGQSTASAVFKWDVGSVANATAIAYQVTSTAFGPYVFGEPLQPNTLITSGSRAGASGQLTIELPLLPPKSIPPANKKGMMADYQVRILPLFSLSKPTVVGAPSNVLVVRTFAMTQPGNDIKITTSKIDPTIDVVKFTWVPYKYTAHWPPGCKPIGEEESDLEAVVNALADAWNWVATAYADAKGFVVNTVVTVVAQIPPNIKIPNEWVAGALDGALMAAGVPPNIPNLDKLLNDGAGYLADQMANQIKIPDEVSTIAQQTGIPVDVAIEKFKNDVKAKAKTAIMNAAQKAKAAVQGEGQSCKGLREYEYVKVTLRNTGSAVQKNVKVEMYDTAGAFKGLAFTLPSLEPGEEVVVPRFLYTPEHLNLPVINKSQLVSENRDASWQAWNQIYFHKSFKFGVRVLGQNCAAGNCTAFTSDEYETPSREWGKQNSKAFSWP